MGVVPAFDAADAWWTTGPISDFPQQAPTGSFVVCMICNSPMTHHADDDRWDCPIHNPPKPVLYDWEQETS